MGQWEGDQQEGEGKCIYADGSQYDGQWKAGLRWGLLSCSRSRDRTYACSNRLRCPARHAWWQACVLAAANCLLHWVACARRHGRGKFAFNRYRYEGGWQEDRQHGAGACQTEAGDKYVGEWMGCGQLAWLSSSRAVVCIEGGWDATTSSPLPACIVCALPPAGEFAEGRRQGRGRCLYADGSKYEGARPARLL
jgi:hypothetical protein